MTYQISEKFRSTGRGVRSNVGGIAILICLHVLLWTSLFVIAGGIYIIAQSTRETSILICTALMTAMACLSVVYIGCHNFTSSLLAKPTTESRDIQRSRLQRLSRIGIQLILLAWLVVSALTIIFTLVRHPSCGIQRHADVQELEEGMICYLQRGCVAASLLALGIAILLFVLMCKVQEPYTYHLFGSVRQQGTVPFSLPYNNSSNRPMFSEMSFKCRSSASLSSKTLVHSFSDSKTTLIPSQPEGHGLGIYAPRSAAPSFLAPRPSLSSIRSYTEAISEQPSTSLLPPLPVYRSKRYRRSNATGPGAPAPKRPVRYKGLQQERTLRIVPPSPALSVANLAAFNQSQVSLSSVYSQDASGRRYSMRMAMPSVPPAVASKPCNSSIDPAKERDELNNAELDDCMGSSPRQLARSISTIENFDSDINDAASLQARLPTVRGVSTFGSVEDWSCGSKARAHYYQSLIHSREAGCRRTLSFRPLMIRKTRNSAAVRDMV